MCGEFINSFLLFLLLMLQLSVKSGSVSLLFQNFSQRERGKKIFSEKRDKNSIDFLLQKSFLF